MEFLSNIIEAFSFPDLASQDGGKVDGLVIAVHLLMLALFVGWITYYFIAIFKYRASRNPIADYKGLKNKTITNSVEGGSYCCRVNTCYCRYILLELLCERS